MNCDLDVDFDLPDNCRRHSWSGEATSRSSGNVINKIKWHHLSNVPLLPLAAAMISRCHVEILRAFLFVSFDHTLAFYVGLLQTKPGQEPFCIEKGPILFYSPMWMIFINEALFTVCFLQVLRTSISTVFALGLLKQLSLYSECWVRPRKRKGGALA